MPLAEKEDDIEDEAKTKKRYGDHFRPHSNGEVNKDHKQSAQYTEVIVSSGAKIRIETGRQNEMVIRIYSL